MRVLFDISHPAHVHFFRNVRAHLERRGDQTLVAARDKDVTHALLDAFAIPYVTHGRAGAKGVLRQATELIGRDRFLRGLVRSFEPDVICTRNPAGVQAARLSRIPGLFDTDDGTSAGIHFRAAAPFASVITSPDSLGEDFGAKHRTYAGYKALAFLHPNHFTPDPTVRHALGLADDEPFSVVRFVSMTASHDAGEQGMRPADRGDVVRRLQRHGRVFVSTEGPLPAEFADLALTVEPDRLHDVLSYATLAVGDSGSVALEAGVLGTPGIFVSSFAGRKRVIDALARDGLAHVFRPDERTDLSTLHDLLDDLATDPGATAAHHAQRRDQMLARSVDVSAWYVDLIDEVASPAGGKRR